MEEALIAYLREDPMVTAALGERIYPVRAPQAVVKPYALTFKVSGLREYDTEGPAGLIDALMQIDVYGTDYVGPKAAARAIIARLSGFRGVYGGVTFQGCFLRAEREGEEEIGIPDELRRVSMDFNIFYTGA